MTQPLIFISYSHKDEREKEKLLAHLGVLHHEGLLDLWSDDRIGVGANWKQEIREAMTQARVVILLISANFLTSDFILGEEVSILLQRRKGEGLTVFPVIAKDCAWQEVSWLAQMSVRPKGGKPIWGGSNRRVDTDLADIAKEVAAIVRNGPSATSTDPTSNDNDRKSPKNETSTTPQSSPSYALVMKGGGVKGLAYVGALKELGAHYKFNWFVGTSAGAIAAVLLAAGYEVSELEDILYKKDFRDFFDAKWYEWPWNFISQKGIHPAYEFTNWIENLLAEKLQSRTQVKLKDLKYRVTIYASRRDEDALIFDSHDPKTQETPAAHAVRCSMSIPFIFTPQMRDGMRVLDGGLRHNYPIDILLRDQPGQNFVGLYLGPEIYEGQAKPPSLIGDLLSIWTEAPDIKALHKYGDQTVIIDPRPIGTVDFGLGDEEKNFLIAAGKVAAHKFLLKQGILTNKAEIASEYGEIKQTRHQIIEKRLKRNRIRRVTRIAVLLVIVLAIAAITLFRPFTWLPKPTEEPTTGVTPTSPPTSTDTSGRPPPSSSVTATSSPVTYTGNLAIPLIAGLGSKVYLTSFDGQGINGPNPIFREAQQPVFSLDGRSILVKATIEGKSGIHKLTASGFNPELSVERPSAEWPVLSPDGETMMFSETTLDFRLHFRMPDETVEEVSLADASYISAKNLLWSEDNQLVFRGCATWRKEPDNCGIWITNVNSLDPQLLIENKEAYPTSIRKGFLAYMTQEDGDWEIYITSLKDGMIVKLTDNDAEDGLPVISPNGAGIAYISNETGAWGLWVMSMEGQNKKRAFIIDPKQGTIDINQWKNERMSWRG